GFSELTITDANRESNISSIFPSYKGRNVASGPRYLFAKSLSEPDSSVSRWNKFASFVMWNISEKIMVQGLVLASSFIMMGTTLYTLRLMSVSRRLRNMEQVLVFGFKRY